MYGNLYVYKCTQIAKYFTDKSSLHIEMNRTQKIIPAKNTIYSGQLIQVHRNTVMFLF